MTGTIAISLNDKLYVGDQILQARISPADRGLLLGDGLFETLPVFNGVPLWQEEHLGRLEQSAKLFDLPLDKTRCEAAIAQLIPLLEGQDIANGIIRLTVTRGIGGRGLLPPEKADPTILASLAPYPTSMAFSRATVVTSPIRRNETSPLSRVKSLAYQDSILATQRANRHNADDALFLNTKGNVSCTTICNIFAIKGETLLTPPVEDGVLPGIMRQKLMVVLPTNNISVIERSLTLEDLKVADGLFLTNSLRIIRPVDRLDEKIYSDEGTGITAQYQELLAAHIKDQTGLALKIKT